MMNSKMIIKGRLEEVKKIRVNFKQEKGKFRIKIKGDVLGPASLTVPYFAVNELLMNHMIGFTKIHGEYHENKGKVSNDSWLVTIEELTYAYIIDQIINKIVSRLNVSCLEFNFNEFEELNDVEVQFV